MRSHDHIVAVPISIGRLLLIRCRFRNLEDIKEEAGQGLSHNKYKESPVRPTWLRSSHNDSLHVVRFLGPRSNDLFPRLQQKPIAQEMSLVYPSASSIASRSFWSYPSITPDHTTILLDSGTQSTMIDLSLAAALHLDTKGATVVAGLGSRSLLP